jgi:hypothetical protein
MKNKLVIIFLLQIIVYQTVKCQVTTLPIKVEGLRKFIHITEFGFLLGRQAPLNNNQIFPAYYYDARSITPYYYPYPTYTSNEQYANFTFQHYTGYNIHKAISVGATVGFDYYRSNIITPLALGVRATLLPSRRISPIINFDGGYGFIWNNDNDKTLKQNKQGGLMINPSAGLRIKLGDDGNSLNIGIGYRVQKSQLVNNRPAEQYFETENRAFNRLSIRLGFGF